MNVTVKLDRSDDRAWPCCHNLAHTHSGNELHCVDCNAHRGTLSREVASFLAELVRVSGVTPELIILRDADQKDSEMKSSAFFPSKYLKASDLNGKPRTATIADVTIEKFDKGETKPALTFRENDKKLILNKTNTTVLSIAFGDETDGWIDQKITLVEIPTANLKGEPVQAIRIASPTRVAPAPMMHEAPKIDPDLNDEIPGWEA